MKQSAIERNSFKLGITFTGVVKELTKDCILVFHNYFSGMLPTIEMIPVHLLACDTELKTTV